MAGVNNVSTYDNAPDNRNNTLERTNNEAADDQDDQDDSLQSAVDNELTDRLRRINGECDDSVAAVPPTPADRVKCTVDAMLCAETAHSVQVGTSASSADHEEPSRSPPDPYQAQRDGSELMVLTEQVHTENSSAGPPGDGGSSEQPSRVFTRPLPVDQTDNVTELVFDTWTTVDEIAAAAAARDQEKATDGGPEERHTAHRPEQHPHVGPAATASNPECFDDCVNVINSVVVSGLIYTNNNY